MKTLFIAVLCIVSLPAAAADFDYSYLDLAYSKLSNDFVTSGGNGYQLDGSWGLGSSGFALEAAYKHNQFGNRSFPGTTFKLQDVRFGAAYHASLSSNLDFVTHADYVSAKTTLDDALVTVHGSPYVIDQSDSGYLVGVGLRVRVLDALELDAFVDHDDTGFNQHRLGNCGFGCGLVEERQDDPETVLSLAARYRFAGAFDVGFEYRHSSLLNGSERLASVRWNF